MAGRYVKRIIDEDLLIDGGLDIGTAFEEFINEKEATVSAKSIRHYMQSYQYFMRYAKKALEITENTPINKITKDCVIKWTKKMQSKPDLRDASIAHYLSGFRTFLNWCMNEEREYIKHRFTVNIPKPQEELPKTTTDNDIEKLLEKPRRYDSFVTWRTWAAVVWALETGDRAGSIRAIRVGDINFKEKVAVLRHTKTKKPKVDNITPFLEQSIKEYMRLWGISDKEAFLFPSAKEDSSENWDEGVSETAFRSAWVRYCKQRGTESTNFHSLRHYFAKRFSMLTKNPAKLQKALGHTSPIMSMHYVDMFASDIADDMEKISIGREFTGGKYTKSQFKKKR